MLRGSTLEVNEVDDPVVAALYDENGVRSVGQRRCSVVAVLTAHLEAGTRASKSR